MPEGLSEAAADLIRRLLQVDPTQRIGEQRAGTAGSSNLQLALETAPCCNAGCAAHG